VAIVEITKGVVDHMVTRLESLTLDSPKIRPRFKYDGAARPDAGRGGLDDSFRRFRFVFPTRAIPNPLHVGTADNHPRLWDLPLGLEINYPFGDANNLPTISGMAIDDSMRVIHHLEVDHTRVTVAGAYEWTGVLVESGDLRVEADRVVVPYAVTAKIQRAF